MQSSDSGLFHELTVLCLLNLVMMPAQLHLIYLILKAEGISGRGQNLREVGFSGKQTRRAPDSLSLSLCVLAESMEGDKSKQEHIAKFEKEYLLSSQIPGKKASVGTVCGRGRAGEKLGWEGEEPDCMLGGVDQAATGFARSYSPFCNTSSAPFELAPAIRTSCRLSNCPLPP